MVCIVAFGRLDEGTSWKVALRVSALRVARRTASLAEKPADEACDHVSRLDPGTTFLAALHRRVARAIPWAQRPDSIPIERLGDWRRRLQAALLARREYGARSSVAAWHVEQSRATVSVERARACSSNVHVAPGPMRRGLRIAWGNAFRSRALVFAGTRRLSSSRILLLAGPIRRILRIALFDWTCRPHGSGMRCGAPGPMRSGLRIAGRHLVRHRAAVFAGHSAVVFAETCSSRSSSVLRLALRPMRSGLRVALGQMCGELLIALFNWTCRPHGSGIRCGAPGPMRSGLRIAGRHLVRHRAVVFTGNGSPFISSILRVGVGPMRRILRIAPISLVGFSCPVGL